MTGDFANISMAERFCWPSPELPLAIFITSTSGLLGDPDPDPTYGYVAITATLHKFHLYLRVQLPNTD